MKVGLGVSLALAVFAMGMMQGPATDRAPHITAVAATSRSAVGEWDQRIGAMAARGDLRVFMTREDTLLPGRTNVRFEQLYEGVPVWGGELVRQEDAAGALSVFGNVLEGIDLNPRPGLNETAARSLMLKRGGAGSSFFPDEVTLTVMPTDDGRYALAWRGRVFTGVDVMMTFVDANSGAVIREYSDRQTQATVGKAVGVFGDTKKIAVTGSGTSYTAQDGLRPPSIVTLDMKGDPTRIDAIFATFPQGIRTTDIATDTDNDWTDGASVDAHVYGGFTYDYFFKRFGRRGLDNANITMRNFVHPIKRELVATLGARYINFYCNAGYFGLGVMVYGEGLPPGWTCGGQSFNYFSAALDVVAHELTHGVTGYSSRLIYSGESGALNEAFSDMMGTSVEFYYQPAGSGLQKADYLLGEDIATGTVAFPLNGFRSMQNPLAYDDPDHYSIRYAGPLDNGGVHTNSGIANQAFYLAIEGGTHRLGGRVTGVGAANREQIEKVFYLAFTSFLVPSSNFAAARGATIQAARQLYPANAAVEAAVTQAWTAVGVN
ncbi:MAG: M4 family metallopeptidase [Vicinamibacteria bacterium]